MAPKKKSKGNHESIGDLVPVGKRLPGHSSGKKLDALIDELQRGGALWDRASKGWQVVPPQLDDAEKEHQVELERPAFTCVVGMPTTVGVLKIASGATGSADCTLFVRLKRSVLDAWCDANGEDKTARRAFRRTLDATQAANLLQGMQPYCLAEGQVHHPQALSVLCLMTLCDVLVLPSVETTRPPTKCGSFTLVGLPPAESNFEQCLTLLGHTSTFLAPRATATAAESDDDEDAPLSSRVDEQLWGPTHGKVFASQWVHKFRNAAEVFAHQADTSTLSTHVPALNRQAPDSARVLEKVCTLFSLAACKPTDEKATGAPPPPPQPKGKTKAAPKPAPAPAASTPASPKKQKVGEAADGVTLAPSDPSDNDTSDAEAPERTAAAADEPSRAPATKRKGAPAASRQCGEGAKKREKGSKRALCDEPKGGETSEEDEPLSSAQSSSEEEDDDAGDEEDAVDAVASERATSDDDEESDDGDAGSSSSAGKARRKKAKTQRLEAPEQDPLPAAAHAFAAQLAARDEALRANMHEVAAQSYEHVLAWKRGERGPAMSEESAYQVGQDLGEIQTAKSPMAIVAAMSHLVKTLANAHHEHFKGETCEVRTAEVKRLHAACARATEFSEATLEEMDKAIEGLTKARDLGRKALERVAPPEARGEPASSA